MSNIYIVIIRANRTVFVLLDSISCSSVEILLWLVNSSYPQAPWVPLFQLSLLPVLELPEPFHDPATKEIIPGTARCSRTLLEKPASVWISQCLCQSVASSPSWAMPLVPPKGLPLLCLLYPLEPRKTCTGTIQRLLWCLPACHPIALLTHLPLISPYSSVCHLTPVGSDLTRKEGSPGGDVGISEGKYF